ncbi:ankyrin, partial [Aspergillus aculeatinus CBS 121060]
MLQALGNTLPQPSLLLVAAEYGHTSVIEELWVGIFEGSYSLDDRCPLLLAAQNGHTMVVEFLLGKGVNVQCVDADGNTVAHLAARMGDFNTLRALKTCSQHAEVPWSELGEHSCTPLHLAAEAGQVEAIRLIVECADAEDMDRVDDRGKTPVQLAARESHLETINVLIAQGAFMPDPLEDSEAPIWLAVEHGHLALQQVNIVQMLFENGADLNAVNGHRETPLHVAAKNHLWSLVNLLVDLGAEVDCQDRDSMSLLHLAAKSGSE